MKGLSAKRCAACAVKLGGAIALAATAGVGSAMADDHTPYWQQRHPQARVYHHPAPRYYNNWHGYRYRGPYYTPYYAYAPPPVVYDPYPSPGVSLFFNF